MEADGGEDSDGPQSVDVEAIFGVGGLNDNHCVSEFSGAPWPSAARTVDPKRNYKAPGRSV
jgi:hypothetical protein